MTFSTLEKGGVGFGTHYVRTARDNEYSAFLRVTRKLQAAADEDRQASIEAVHENNQLWTLLADDLASSANLMPAQVKAGLISLAIFSIKYGRYVLSQGGAVDVLIDINVKVMKGLHGGSR